MISQMLSRLSRTSSHPSRRSNRARQAARRRSVFMLERVEDRTLLSNWIGAVDSDWFTPGNWNDGIPSATKPAVIDATNVVTGGSTTPKLTGAGAVAQSLTIGAGVTLDLNSYTLDVNANVNSNVAQGFTQTGGAVTGAGASTLLVGGDFTQSGGTFTANNVTFKGVRTATVTADTAFNNVTIAYGTHHLTVAAAKPLSVNGNLNITGYNTITGVINAKGAVTTSAPFSSNGSLNGTLNLVGAGQTLTGSGDGALPRVVNNQQSAGNTLTLSGSITPDRWTQVRGKLSAGTSTTTFRRGTSGTDVTVDTGSTQLGSVIVNVGPNFIVKQLNVGGDLKLQSVGNFIKAAGGADTVKVAGDLSSTVSSTIGGGLGITMTGGGSANIYTGPDSSTLEPGNFPKSGITIDKIWSSTVTANIDETTPLAGPLKLNTLGTLNGTLYVAGSVTTNDTSVGGNALVVFNGAGIQYLTAGVNGGQIPGLKFDKPSGSVKVVVPVDGFLGVTGGWEAVDGTLVGAAGTTVQFAGNGYNYSSRTIDTGVNSFNNVEINGVWSNTLTIQKMDIAGNLAITEVGTINGPGAITLAGSVTSSDSSVAGNAILVLNGAGDQHVTAEAAVGVVPGLKIDKLGGSVTLDSENIIGVNGGWEVATTNHKSVAVNTGGSTVRFIGNGYNYANRTISAGKYAFDNVQLNLVWSNVLNVVGAMKMTGGLTINEVGTINAASGAITVAGDLISNDTSVGGDANITMVGNTPASITGGDFPSGGIIITKGSTTLNANVTTPIRGPLAFNGNTALVLDGALKVAGDVTTGQQVRGEYGTVVFAGNKPQNLTATSAKGGLPNVEIAKGGNTLTINGFSGDTSNPFSVYGNWNVTDGNAGSVNAGGATIRLAYFPTNVNNKDFYVNTGTGAKPMQFGNVLVDVASGSTYRLNVAKPDAAPGDMAVSGDLTVSKIRNISGDITMVGNTDTKVSYTRTLYPGDSNGGLIINKATGKKLSLLSNVDRLASVNVLGGTLDFGTYAMTVTGAMSVAPGAGLAFTATNNVTQLKVGGDLTFASGSTLNVDLTAIAAQYDLIQVTGAGKKLINNGVTANGTGSTTYELAVPDTGTEPVNGKIRVVSIS